MAVYETYSHRQRKAARAGQPDVYRYDKLPPFLRVQLGMIFKACFGDAFDMEAPHWQAIASTCAREIETFHEWAAAQRSATRHKCIYYLTAAPININDLLDFIEICCHGLMARAASPAKSSERQTFGITQDAKDGLEEVDARFQNAGVGYKFEAGEIVRVDSQYIHAELVKPALELLADAEFAQANGEFRAAHEHYRSGHLRDCNTAALRCMETVLKTICEGRSWGYDPKAPIEPLITVVRSNGLFPDYLGGYFNNLIGAMKAGAPKVRDRDGGHGAGPGDAAVPEHIAGFALHSAAAGIVMLVQAYRSLG
jgi:hypothetical protein